MRKNWRSVTAICLLVLFLVMTIVALTDYFPVKEHPASTFRQEVQHLVDVYGSDMAELGRKVMELNSKRDASSDYKRYEIFISITPVVACLGLALAAAAAVRREKGTLLFLVAALSGYSIYAMGLSYAATLGISIVIGIFINAYYREKTAAAIKENNAGQMRHTAWKGLTSLIIGIVLAPFYFSVFSFMNPTTSYTPNSAFMLFVYLSPILGLFFAICAWMHREKARWYLPGGILCFVFLVMQRSALLPNFFYMLVYLAAVGGPVMSPDAKDDSNDRTPSCEDGL